ncbi:MAG: SGNH/GDSL hydrolase family protein [Deltaproteobacteria bacterium]|nr:SGNH/GDSL hydrolase family protein [Deltaproteobacteria bacterium]
MPSKVIKYKRYANHCSLLTALRIFIFLLFLIAISSCGSSHTQKFIPVSEWISTWATAQQPVEPHNLPPAPGLDSNTIRQVVQVTIGGEMLRVRFSNEYGTSPVTIKSARIAVSTGKGAIDRSTEQRLRFDTRPDTVIIPGATVTSDPVIFTLIPRSRVAVTIHFGDTSPDVTGHPGSRTTSFLGIGNLIESADLTDVLQADHWYIIDSIDVQAGESSGALIVLGDSITDGRGSGTNRQNRWPDELYRRLKEKRETAGIAVLNMGLGGNCVLRECLGPAALKRFPSDVLDQSRARFLIILEGINDIGQTKSREEADKIAKELIDAYAGMITLAHEKGILVYGATLMPFGGSFYDSEWSEQARQRVNEWIRNSGRFDAVIDMERAVADPANPRRMLPEYDTGDHLHPNETGHRVMAEKIDLNLFIPLK